MVKLRVGMITCWYKNISMANYSSNLKKALEKKGVKIQIVTSNCICEYAYHSKTEIFQGKCRLVSQSLIPFIKITEKDFRKPMVRILHSIAQMTRGMKYLAKCRDCHIIHYQQSSPFSFGSFPLIPLLLIPTPQKKIVTIHNFDRLITTSKTWVLNRIYKYAEAIIVHSKEHKKRAIKLGIPKHKIRVIPHGAQFTKELGLKKRRITFFGAPIERKGFFTLIKALKILKDSGVKITLEIYGIYGANEKNDAIKEVKRLNVGDMLQWHGKLSEFEFDKKMQESMFTFAVYLNPVAGSSIITRAMINGTLVIASDVGGSKEYLGDASIFVPPNDPKALANAIQFLLENRKLCEKLGKEARKRAIELFSWDKTAKETVAVYDFVLKDKLKQRKKYLGF